MGNRVKALHGGSLASFLEPPLHGNDRHAEESSQPDHRDVSAPRRLIGRISPKAKISSPGLRYSECLGLPFGDVIAHLKVPDVVLCLRITLGLHLSPHLLTILKIVQTNKGARLAKKKRAPGAGRKPRGEFMGKTATLTTRIKPETRAALERAAEKSGRSLSQEVEHRLDYSIRRDYEHNRHRHIRALAEAIAILIHWVERATQKRWIDDPFTAEALRRGIEFLVFHFGAPGTPEVPASVKDAAARVPLQARDQSMTPAGVGHAEAGGLISWIEMNLNEGGRLSRPFVTDPRKLDFDPSKLYVPAEWYLYSQVFTDLGSGWERRQKLMRKEGSR